MAMIADHIGGDKSWLYPVTGGNQFFVSAAEAFILISGAVMGIVYLNVFLRDGLGAALMKAFHRTWTLYVVTVVLTLSFAATAYLLHLPWSPDVSNGGVGQFALDVMTLHRTIYLADVILIYVLLLLAAGPVIVLLSQGRTRVVLAASWGLWVLWQLLPHTDMVPWEIQGNEVFFFPAWQVLFVTGLVLGWHRTALERWVSGLSGGFMAWAFGGAVVLVGTLYTLQLTSLEALRNNHLVYDLAFDKADVPIGRLAVFLVLAIVGMGLLSAFWVPISRATGWLLMPLGQNALTAYSVHIFVVAATAKLTETMLTQTELVDTGLQLGGILLVWLIIVTEHKYARPIRQRIDRGLQGLNVAGHHTAGAGV